MIKNKAEYYDFISADKAANSISDENSFQEKLKLFLYRNYTWQFILYLRRCEYLKNCRKDLFGKLLFIYYYKKFKVLSLKLGFSIPLNVFGPGVSIPHYGTIVVNGNSKIGKNCRIHASVNIGASGGSDIAPVIGDNVYIGPGAILFGEILIADNVTIAANATVYKNFEIKNTTIGGTPAVVLKEQTNTWWEKNRLSL
jgi:serine O-acetyltransferase